MNDDQFDQQIRDALRAEPASEQIARLETFWRTTSRRERRSRTVRRALALAASLLVVAVVAAWTVRQEFGGVEVVQAPQPNPVIVPQRDSPKLDPPQIAVADTPPPSIGRAPTAMEQFAFFSRTQPRGSAANEVLVAVVDDLVQQVAGGEVNPQQAVEATGIAMEGLERELLRRLVRSTDDQKRNLSHLLAACGSDNSILPLLKLSRREVFRDEALQAIEQIVGVTGLAEVVRLSDDSRVRQVLMQRLLTAESDDAVAAYLTLVQDPSLRVEALAVADALPNVPTEVLLAFLQSDDKRARLSAALLLGRVNGPEITRRLVDLVTAERPAPTEAWIALLACRGELAQEFLSYAASRPQLLGQVNNARIEWARMRL